ncbi:MAG: hypothetical protein R2867_07200 [Caldilineaceae bacterium]
MTRREVLPTEADHPRADDYYFRIEIGPLQRSQTDSGRRSSGVTFIHTTFDQLLTAEKVSDLFRKDDPFERLWHSLREHKLRPLKNRLVGDRPVDITLRARGGYLGIDCPEIDSTQERRLLPLADRWEFLSFSATSIEQIPRVAYAGLQLALISLGGSNLNLPPQRSFQCNAMTLAFVRK